MSATRERLSSLDATFLELEQADEGATMHIGGALIFDCGRFGTPPTLDDVCALVEERFGALPRFRCRLSGQRVHGLRRPDWIEDPHFDVRGHVRHATLPAPGGEAEIHEWLSDFWSHRLDRARPLWEMTLVDGLADGAWMLATKTHHAMVDGVGSMDIGHVLLDLSASPEPREVALDVNGAGHDRQGLAAVLGAARGALGLAVHPERLLKAGEAAVAMGEVLWQDEVLAARPSTLNVPIGTSRRFASVALDLAEVKEVKTELGGTVNDVVLAVAAGALRRLLKSRGEELERPLRAMVPVNMRGDDHGILGNRVTSLFVELPIGQHDRRRRYAKTRAAATALKSGTAALGGSTIVRAASVAPPLLHETIARTLFAPRLFNVTITNVPGPQFPLYALGARLRSIIPLVPLFAGHTIGIAIVSYDGQLVFGVNADYASAPDLDVLTDGLRDEFDALVAIARL